MQLKVLLPLFLILISSFSLSAQRWLRPSGEIATKEYNFSDFKGIRISNDFKAYVRFASGKEQVSIKADDNLFQYIRVEMDGDILDIRLRDHMSIRGEETLKAYITAEAISSFEADNDAEIFLENKLSTASAEVSLSGDSVLKGEVDIEELDVRLSSDSVMKLSGKSEHVNALLKGDSILEDYDFDIQNLKVTLKGDSVARLTVHQSIDVKAAGDSVFHYKGAADVVNMTVVGDSEVKRRD